MTPEEIARFAELFIVQLERAAEEAKEIILESEVPFADGTRLTRAEQLALVEEAIRRADALIKLEAPVSRLRAALVSVRETGDLARERLEGLRRGTSG